ncbi:MAG: excinuclease ABC subunit C [Acidobacteriaceae bacterium]
MSAAFQLQHRIEFLADNSDEILRAIPAAPGVFALRGSAENSEPYVTRTADLRRRLRRLLAPPEAVDEQGRPVLSKRLNLRERVRWIEWTRTGSEFESALFIYRATRAAFGDAEARRRLRLHAPYFLRITMQHEHPRVYVTNKLSRRSLNESFGPFPSRLAAERYCDAVLDLFKLRRCHEDLQVHPEHPGCAYGEMKMCMEPCKGACTAEDYAAEARRVQAFFATRGESMLAEVAQQREAASEAMDFEQAAALHKQWERVKAAAMLADELVRPIAALRAVVLQEAAPAENPGAPHLDSEMWASTAANPPIAKFFRNDEAAVFLFANGRLTGPARLSTLGVRAVREQTAVGSSLFAQPLMLAAVPLEETSVGTTPTEPQDSPREFGVGGGFSPLSGPANEMGFSPGSSSAPTTSSTRTPEDRARTLIALLVAETQPEPDIPERCDYLALFRRWYYRPEKQRMGEVFLPNPDGSWPIRRILNRAARVVLGPPTAAPPVDREAFKDLKTKVIHQGRADVERVVPVLPKCSRTRKSLSTAEVETTSDFGGES